MSMKVQENALSCSIEEDNQLLPGEFERVNPRLKRNATGGCLTYYTAKTRQTNGLQLTTENVLHGRQEILHVLPNINRRKLSWFGHV